MIYPVFKKLLLSCFSVLLFAGISYSQQRVPVYYTVKPQEGLYRVAVNNKVTMEEIRRWNNLSSDNLSIGQRLIVGYKETTEESYSEPAREKESDVSYDAGNRPRYYTVQAGEGLYRVAVNNSVTMAEIRSWNNLTSDNLSAGQKLIVGYEVSAPDYRQEEETDVKQTSYEEALADGNKAFAEQRYDEAKKIFEAAIVINPKSYIAKKRINEIDVILAKRAESTDTVTATNHVEAAPVIKTVVEETPPTDAYSAFWFYVKKGDVAMGEQNYNTALSYYKEASKIYPSKAYPKAKIQEIEAMHLVQDTVPATEESPVSEETLVNESESEDTLEISSEQPLMEEETKKSILAFTHFAVLKSKPSDFSKLLEYIPENSEVKLIGFNNNMRDYYKVSYNGMNGWVPEKNIKKTKEVMTFKTQSKAAEKYSDTQ